MSALPTQPCQHGQLLGALTHRGCTLTRTAGWRQLRGGGGKGSQAQASPTQSQTMNSLHPDSVSPGRGQGRSSHK